MKIIQRLDFGVIFWRPAASADRSDEQFLAGRGLAIRSLAWLWKGEKARIKRQTLEEHFWGLSTVGTPKHFHCLCIVRTNPNTIAIRLPLAVDAEYSRLCSGCRTRPWGGGYGRSRATTQSLGIEVRSGEVPFDAHLMTAGPLPWEGVRVEGGRLRK